MRIKAYILATIVAAFFCLAQGLNMCSPIQFEDYYFDLSTFSKTLDFGLSDGQGIVKFYNCDPSSCQSGGYNSNTDASSIQKSYILRLLNKVCTPMTINNTISQNYKYIDSTAPEKGLKIQYLPYITWQNVTDQNNNTYVYQASYSAVFSFFCNSVSSLPNTCTQKVGSNVSEVRSGVNYLTSTVQIICTTYVSNGCPTLKNNNFWKFLVNNQIWFMIILWVVSIFQLFMGYFVIRLTILIYGIMTGAMTGIMFSALNYQDFFYDNEAYGISAFLVILSFFMGLMFGIALLTLPKLGYINIGFWDAVIFSLLLQNSALYATGSMMGFYITLGISGFLMAGISLLGFRKFIIASTSFISAFWIVRTLGFVLPYYPNEFTATKMFVINKSTPWQFYLYLLSMIILAALGCTFQFCWYKKKGKDHGNKGFYLEDDDSFKNKLKKLLQFDDIKKMISAGKEEVMFLKNLVANRGSEMQEHSENDRQPERKGKFIEMMNIKNSKLQAKNTYAKNQKVSDSEDDDATQQAKIKKSGNKLLAKKERRNSSEDQKFSIQKILNKQTNKSTDKKSLPKRFNPSEDEKNRKKLNKSNLSDENEMKEIKKDARNNTSSQVSKGKQVRKYEQIENDYSSQDERQAYVKKAEAKDKKKR